MWASDRLGDGGAIFVGPGGVPLVFDHEGVGQFAGDLADRAVGEGMTPEDTEPLLRRMLADADVSEAHPDPAAAWEVFKQYATVPAECARDYLFFQVGDGHPESGLDGYFDFTREFEMRGASGDEPVWFEQVHIEFKVPHQSRLGVGTVILYSADFPDYDAFFAAVEQSAAFRAGLAFRGFVLAVYHTGV